MIRADVTALVLTAWLLGGLVALYLGLGLVGDVRLRRRQALFERSSEALGRVLFADEETAAAAVDDLASLPPTMVLDTGKRLVTDFAGQVGPRMSSLVAALGLGRRIRRQMTARSWRRRAQGASLAVLLPSGDPDRTRLLLDRHPTVRARAVEGLDADDVRGAMETVVRMLDDPNEGVRLGAQQALLRSGGDAVPALERLLTHGRGRAVLLALEVAGSNFDPRLVPALERHLGSGDPVVRAMALRALPLVAVDETVVRAMLDDDDAEVRAVAATSVGSAGRQHLAAAVGRLLGDPAWTVRHAAGGALAELGPAGLMTLRLALDHEDRYARDMARQTLDAIAAHRGAAAGVLPATPDPTVDDWYRSGHVGLGVDERSGTVVGAGGSSR